MVIVEQMLGVLENICSGEGDRVLNAITYRIRQSHIDFTPRYVSNRMFVCLTSTSVYINCLLVSMIALLHYFVITYLDAFPYSHTAYP